MYQMADSLGGVVFIIFVLVFAALILRIIYLVFQHRSIKLLILIMIGLVGLYIIILLVFSILSKDQLIPEGSIECFDDWCASVLSSTKTSAIGSVKARGEFVIITVKVINQAKKSAQTPDHPQIQVVDTTNKLYYPSMAGQNALMQQGQQTPLDKRLDAGQSYTLKLVYDLPADNQQLKALLTEGTGPPMIGDQNSLLHKKTYFQLY